MDRKSERDAALDPDEVGRHLVLQLLIALLVVLNVYEFAVIGLGLWLIAWAQEHLPTTKLHWGATAISTAFGLLLLGGLLSWWSKQRERRGLR